MKRFYPFKNANNKLYVMPKNTNQNIKRTEKYKKQRFQVKPCEKVNVDYEETRNIAVKRNVFESKRNDKFLIQVLRTKWC
jgi:hypothetical protein